MMALEDILSQEIVQKLGWTLLHFVWQAAVAALLLTVLLRVLRKSAANLRYVLACLTLGLIVLLPVVTFHLVPISASYPTAPVEPAPVPSVLPMEETKQVPVAEMPVLEKPVQPVENIAITPKVSWKQRAVELLEPALPYIVSGWLVGVFGLFLWHLGGWTQMQRLRRRMVKQIGPPWQSKLKELAKLLGIRRVVQLMESALVRVPTVVGWLRPVILLPASALTGLSSEQLGAILAHELAHIRRYDYLVNMLQTVVEIVGFYHPAVWWVSNKIRVERESCCDDLAVSISGNRVRYARALTQMEEIRSTKSKLAVAMSGGNLFCRIRRLVGTGSVQNSRYGWAPAVIAIILIAALAIPTTLALTSPRENSADGIEAMVIKGFRANRDKFECGVLAWSRKSVNNRYADSNDPRRELAGQYELWWDGKKIATKYIQDQVYTDPTGRFWVDKQQGGNSYDGSLLSRKPRFNYHENWLGPVTRWRGDGSLDKLILGLNNLEHITKDWSVVDANGVKLIRVMTRNMNETARDYGAYSIRDYDSSKGYGLVNEEWYNPDGSQRLKHTVKMLEAIPGGWFPVEVDFKSFAITDGKVYSHNHYALDIERCSFNDKSALPDRVFKWAVDKQLKYQEKLQKYLAMELRGLSDVKEAAKADKVKRGAREAIETFVAAALAGDFEKAGKYAHPDRLPANQIADITEIAKGQNLWIMAVVADDWSAMAVSSVIQGDHSRMGPLVFCLDRIVLNGRDNWWVHDIDMETPDRAEVELKQFLKEHPEAKKVPSENKTDVQVEDEGAAAVSVESEVKPAAKTAVEIGAEKENEEPNAGIKAIFAKADKLQGWGKQRSREYLSSLSDEELAKVYARATAPQKAPRSTTVTDPDVDKVRKNRAGIIEELVERFVLDEEGRKSFGLEYRKLEDELAGLGAKAVPILAKYVGGLDFASTHHRGGLAKGALLRMGSSAVKSLIKLMGSKDKMVRAGSANILSKLGDPRANDVLLRALDDEAGNVRRHAFDGLVRLGPDVVGHDKLVTILIEHLQDDYWWTMWTTIEALKKFGNERAIEPLGVIEYLHPARGKADQRFYARRAMNAILRRVGKPVKEASREDYTQKAPTYDELCAAAQCPNAAIRRLAIGWLDRHRDEQTALFLIRRIKEEQNPTVLEEIVRSLRSLMLQPKDSSEPVVSPQVMQKAFDAFVSGEAIPALSAKYISVLNPSDLLSQKERKLLTAYIRGAEGVVYTANKHQMRLERTERFKNLFWIWGLSSKDEKLRVASYRAVITIARLSPKTGKSWLQYEKNQLQKQLAPLLNSRDPHIGLIQCLGYIGDKRLTPRLTEVLEHDNWRVRMSAAHALGRIGDSAALPTLKHLAETDPHQYEDGVYGVRKAAIEAIDKIRRKQTGPTPAPLVTVRVAGDRSSDELKPQISNLLSKLEKLEDEHLKIRKEKPDVRVEETGGKTAKSYRKRYFATLVVTDDGVVFKGQKLTWEQVQEKLKTVPDRQITALEVGVDPAIVPDNLRGSAMLKWVSQSAGFQKAAQLRQDLGFEYLSNVGVDRVSSRRGPVSVRFEDALRFGEQIPVALMSFEEQPLLRTTSIEFEKAGADIRAVLKAAVTSYPKKSWEIGVRLLDAQGRQITSEVETFENSGLARGYPVHTQETMNFSFGQAADLANAKRFEVKLRQFTNKLAAGKTDAWVEVEEKILKRFFNQIDREIGELKTKYPQLADWNAEKTDAKGFSTGKEISENRLIYNHAVFPGRSPGSKDWCGENGCHIQIARYTSLEGPYMKTRIFPLKKGTMLSVIARVITGNPEVPELEQKINDIFQSAATSAVQKPDVQVEVEGAGGKSGLVWGEAVEGVQMRVRLERQKWYEGETPKFLVDMRNKGTVEWELGLTPGHWEVELDGLWYRIGASFSGWFQTLPFGPGQEHKDIEFYPGVWSRWNINGKPLKFTPGLHTVRLSFGPSTRDRANWRRLRAVSNVVVIEVLPAEADKRDWGEAVAGLQCGLRADKRLWKADETPRLQAVARNVGERPWPLPRPSELLYLKAAGKIWRWKGPGPGKGIDLKPGEDLDKTTILLSEDWVSPHDSDLRLKLSPGKHTVQLVMIVTEPAPARGPTGTRPIPKQLRIESNVVVVEVLPTGERPGTVDDEGDAATTLQAELYELWQQRDSDIAGAEAFGKKLLEKYKEREEQALIYYQLAEIYAQSGQISPSKTIEYARAGWWYLHDAVKKARLFVYWGDALQLSKGRRDAAKIYLRGLEFCLRYGLPKEKPELPAVSRYRVDGPPEVVEEYHRRNQLEMAAWKQVKRIRELIEHRKALTGQIVQLYAREPDAFDELRELVMKYLHSEEAAEQLIAAAKAYRRNQKVAIPVIMRMGPDPKPDADLLWGQAAEGIRVRLRAERAKWAADETPKFKVDVRNDGSHRLLLTSAPDYWGVEVDGVWYRVTIPMLGGAKGMSFGPDKRWYNLELSLDMALGSQNENGGFELAPGRHTVRAALAKGLSEDGGPVSIRAVSNPVEIEILPAKTDVQEATARRAIAEGRSRPRRIEFLGLDLTDAPCTTKVEELPDLFEARPPGSKSYHIRKDVTVVYNWLDGTVYYIPKKNIFYVQHDLLGASTLHYYGPFKGDPREVFRPLYGSVTGTVRFHGTGAPASGVVVKTISKWFDTVQARTDQQGSYTLAGIRPEAVFHITAEDEQKELFVPDMPAVVLKPGEAKTE